MKFNCTAMTASFLLAPVFVAADQDVIEHCRKNLTNYKVPKLVEFRAELPKTNVGKILRRELRDS